MTGCEPRAMSMADASLAAIARRRALAHVAHGRALQRAALLHLQRQIDASTTPAQVRALVAQQLGEYEAELQLVADQIIATPQDAQLIATLTGDVLADAAEGAGHA